MAKTWRKHSQKKGWKGEGRYSYKNLSESYKYKSIYGKSYCEVKEFMENIRNQIEKKSQTLESERSENISTSLGNENLFNEIAEKWLDQINSTRKYSTYIKYLRLYELYIKDALKQAKISDISNFFVNENIFKTEQEKNISANTRHSIIVIMNQILQYASDYFACSEIELSNKFVKVQNKRIEIINHSEQALLLRYLSHNMDISKAGIILCISTGLRLGEICSLKWEDIDYEQMIIHIRRTVQRIACPDAGTKTSLMVTPPKSIFSAREIPISKEINMLLNQMSKMQTGSYILGGNMPLEPRTYQKRFKKYLQDINVKEYNFHTLRHTFATNCIDSGMDVKSLSEILGHSDVKITLNKYVHPTMETKRKHIAALTSGYEQYCNKLSRAEQ